MCVYLFSSYLYYLDFSWFIITMVIGYFYPL